MFDVPRYGWSISEDILDEYLRPAFYSNPAAQEGAHEEEVHQEEPATPPSFTYMEEPSLFYHGEGYSSQPPSGWNPWDQRYQ